MADFGVYRGAAALTGIAATEAWLGVAVQRALDGINFTTWDNTVANSPASLGGWVIGAWGKQSRKMTYMLPIGLFGTRTPYAEIVSGAHDDAYTLIGKLLVAKGQADAILRLGWEFNGGWFAHTATRDPGGWVAAFQRIVTTMRAVPGAAFKFDWNPSLGMQGIRPDAVYPGDAYVDVIGLDVYNQWWTPAEQPLLAPDGTDAHADARWKWIKTQGFGLDWHAAFALKHGKPMSYPEWGTGSYTNKPNGGGDDPVFVQNMLNWIGANNVLYHNLWDYDAPDYHARLSGATVLPKASAMFRQVFLAGRPNLPPPPDQPLDPDMVELASLRVAVPELQQRVGNLTAEVSDLGVRCANLLADNLTMKARISAFNSALAGLQS